MARTIDPTTLPRHFDWKATSVRLRSKWQTEQTYRCDVTADDTANAFSVDTPPPTVSGSLHIGHVFSYVHTDIIVRYHRMLGDTIFYPMGWDDNGLPTERRVENYFHVRCDPEAVYEPDLSITPANARTRKEPARQISRKNFTELCKTLTEIDEVAFKELWQSVGLSVDWELEYATIGKRAQAFAQYSFVDLWKKGHLYTREAPTMWDVDFGTAVAQAELEDRHEGGRYYEIEFALLGPTAGSRERFTIATTRPELLPACVGITAHPDDDRYRHLFGSTAVTPVFGVSVPIFPSREADPDQGTGILMVCTFGDSQDVDWWRRESLATRQILGKDGRLTPLEFGSSVYPSQGPAAANAAYARLAGKSVAAARIEIIQILADAAERTGLSFHPGEVVTHAVKHYEKGKRPVEFITSRQWFVKLLDEKEQLLERGKEIDWYPSHMGLRYRDWVSNLAFDWCISRQRFFGVPFPVWYPLDATGKPNYGRPIVAPPADLPVDPMVDRPPGYSPEQRNEANGFAAESDVFDTWFTSSLSPQIASGWYEGGELYKHVFPMDVRSQSHEIIRTWAFYTIAKAHLHEGCAPWRSVQVSGWVLDPDRKKMSKSVGNTVTPTDTVERYGPDAVRYWSGSARLGVDTAASEAAMKNGKRLVTKLYNAAKFTLSLEGGAARGSEESIIAEIDRSFVDHLRDCVGTAGREMGKNEFAAALAETEDFFFHSYTDTYLELVKDRAKDDEPTAGKGERISAVTTLRLGLHVLLRLFAPVLPFVTDEIWSWAFAKESGFSSIHRAPWPTVGELAAVPPATHSSGEFPSSLECATAIIAAVRKAKTEHALSLRTPIGTVVIEAPKSLYPAIEAAREDVQRAGNLSRLRLQESPAGEMELRITSVELPSRDSSGPDGFASYSPI